MFQSAIHNNRYVVFVGGGTFEGKQKSEILDYTLEGSTWQECNYPNRSFAIKTIKFIISRSIILHLNIVYLDIR